MVDRAARNEAVAVIDAYLDDQITAFEFDERLGIDTQDMLVNEITALAWFHYDDCKDHEIVMTAEQWNLFQRLLLLLKSDADVSAPPAESRRRRWDHWLALAGFASCCTLACWVGWNGWLLPLALPFATLAFFIHAHQVRITPVMSVRELACFPFASLGELRQVRRRTPGFVKRRHRPEVAGRVVRGEGWEEMTRLIEFVGLGLLAPLALLGQSLPSSRHETPPWLLKLPEAA